MASPIPPNRNTQRDELVYVRQSVKSIMGHADAHENVIL